MSPSTYPYADRFEIHRRLPEVGLRRDEVLVPAAHHGEGGGRLLGDAARCSGTMYCGDHDHYSLHERGVRPVRPRERPPARHVPERHQVRGRDHLHDPRPAPRRGGAATGDDPCGLVTTGGTGSIAARRPGLPRSTRPRPGASRARTSSSPRRRHPAFDKACHLFGVELRRAPVDPVTTQVDVDWVRDHIDDQTVALIGSACNYGYGTVDPISELSDLALERGIGLHVDGCLGGFILPFGQELGYDIPVFDYRLPGVTSISADTHKYGYAFKGSSVLSFRDQGAAQRPVLLPDRLERREVHLARGWRARGRADCIAATWAAMVQLGPPGYLDYARQIFETSFAMQDAVRSHPELRMMGHPTFLFSLHLRRVRHLPRQRLHADHGAGASTASSTPTPCTWRSPGRRPSPAWPTTFATDLADAVAYATEHAAEAAEVRGDLRRRGRRHDRRGRRVHPRRHGRHARLAIGDPRFMSGGAPTGWIAGCVASHAALLADIDGLTDARRPAVRVRCPAGAWATSSPTWPATPTAWSGASRARRGARCWTSTRAG